MKVIVRKVNYKRGLVVFEEENGDCGYFEILDSVDLEEAYGMSYRNAVTRVFR